MLTLTKLERPVLILLLFLPIMTGVSFYLYKKYTQTTQDIHSITYTNLVKEKSTLIHNFIDHMHSNIGENAIQRFDTSSELREDFENRLRVLVTSEVKYLYMLHYDETSEELKLHYTLDTAIDEDEKAYFNQKFDAQSDIWEKVKKTKKEQLNQFLELDTLWISLVVPIIENGEVVAAIGVDFSNDARSKINEVVDPMQTLYFYIAIFMFIMLIAAYLQFILYYKTNRQGHIDPLTKIYNRQYLTALLKRINLSHYQIFMLDIDHFKKVNDTYGHDVGDIVLQSVSGRISSITRANDFFIRYGGEEFILLINKQHTNKTQKIAQRILDIIQKDPVHTNEESIHVTISIGINPLPENSANFDAALKLADEQLYLAKNNGRNRFEITS